MNIQGSFFSWFTGGNANRVVPVPASRSSEVVHSPSIRNRSKVEERKEADSSVEIPPHLPQNPDYSSLIRLRVDRPKQGVEAFAELINSGQFSLYETSPGYMDKGYSFKHAVFFDYFPDSANAPYSVRFSSSNGHVKPYIMCNLGSNFLRQGKSEGSSKTVRLEYDVHAQRFVVMKKPKPQDGVVTNKTKFAFQKEHRIAQKMGRFSDLVDFSEKGEYLISESMDGDLIKLLTSCRTRSQLKSILLPIAENVAKDLQRLHDVSVVHGDLKLENVLYSQPNQDTLHIQVDDFDLSLEFEPGTSGAIAARLRGTFHILAPELAPALDRNIVLYSPQSDVFAFGVLMLDLFCGTGLFIDKSSSTENGCETLVEFNRLSGIAREKKCNPRGEVISRRYKHCDAYSDDMIASRIDATFNPDKLSFSRGQSVVIRSVIKDCLKVNPNDRISLDTVITRLEALPR